MGWLCSDEKLFFMNREWSNSLLRLINKKTNNFKTFYEYEKAITIFIFRPVGTMCLGGTKRCVFGRRHHWIPIAENPVLCR